MPKIAALAISILIVTFAVTGCGGSSKSSSSSSSSGAAAPTTGSASSTLSDAANPSGQLKFTSSSLTAKAGKVTVQFTNKSSIAHNFTIQGSGGVVGSTPTFAGGTKSFTVNLKPGTYTFYCSVPGHRQAGMQGTITVK
jgi:plastocyanin